MLNKKVGVWYCSTVTVSCDMMLRYTTGMNQITFFFGFGNVVYLFVSGVLRVNCTLKCIGV